MKGIFCYFAEIKIDKIILWCYAIWYGVMVYFYFDPSPKIWLNSLGISAVIGTGLMLSVSSAKSDRWQVMRLYLMPFCVSSFSALIKDAGFLIVIPPKLQETLVALFCCGLFLSILYLIKYRAQGGTQDRIQGRTQGKIRSK
ncbi:MAG: hypothetical protein ACOYME_02850 [Prochlorotrichaceae cyanobacterium]|jgi:hypothetical protein